MLHFWWVIPAIWITFAGGVPRNMRTCDVQLTGKSGYCIDTRTCISGYPELMGKRLRPVLPLLTKVHDCPSSTSMCCPVDRVAAVEAIGDLPNLPDISKCGRVEWNGTYYDTPKYVLAEIDDYMDMAHEVTNNIDIEDNQFGEELFDLMGATGNFVNMDTNDLLSRAEELKNYTEKTNFHGGLANEGQFNFIARLEYETFMNPFNQKVMRLCGGVLINPSWVLTAGHCLQTTSGSLKSVTLGGYDVNHPSSQTIPVGRIYPNPNYRGKRNYYQNDIGLIKLKYPADLSNGTVSVACLPSISKHSLIQKYVFAIGWGLVNIDDAHLKGLKFARLPVVATKECNSILPLNGQSQICAGGTLQDTCYGDSGAPLVSILQNDHNDFVAFVAGVTSYGPDQCGTWERPGIYTNVQYFLPWITKTIYNDKFSKI